MNNITQNLQAIEGAVKRYAATEYPAMAGKKALRFIDDNFRNQSWEGQPWKKRKKNTGATRALLVLRGALRRGNMMKPQPGAVMIYNNVKYAKAHNEGLRSTVQVPQHTRRRFGKFKASNLKSGISRTIKTEASSGNVKAHSMRMNIPRRQFFPTAQRPSATLTNAVKRQVTLDVYKILKSS